MRLGEGWFNQPLLGTPEEIRVDDRHEGSGSNPRNSNHEAGGGFWRVSRKLMVRVYIYIPENPCMVYLPILTQKSWG